MRMQPSEAEKILSRLVATTHPSPPNSDIRRAMWQGELRTERDAFQRTFEDAGIGMAVVDLNGRFVQVNNALCRMLGFTDDELLDLTFAHVTYPEDLNRSMDALRSIIDGEATHFHLEKRYLQKVGQVVWSLLSASLIRDSEGRPCYFVVQIQDITARKTAEHQSALRLRDIQRLTHTVNQLLRSFEGSEDEKVYVEVLQIARVAFQSKTGLFLRFDDDGSLVGPYYGAAGLFTARFELDRCELWSRVIEEQRVIADNERRDMGYGLSVTRSLVTLPPSLIHLEC